MIDSNETNYKDKYFINQNLFAKKNSKALLKSIRYSSCLTNFLFSKTNKTEK